jgi:hypothetical protein
MDRPLNCPSVLTVTINGESVHVSCWLLAGHKSNHQFSSESDPNLSYYIEWTDKDRGTTRA